MLGTCPDISGGLLLITVEGAAEDCVTIDDVEFDRVGEAGLWLKNAAAGGDGAVSELAESLCR